MKTSVFFMMMFCGFTMCVAAHAQVGEAQIKATKDGSPVSGRLVITEKDNGIDVEASVQNVAPGKHGFHFHEVGQCDDEGKAAGGHFNPEKVQHGFLPNDGRQHAHAGDMGNIDVAADGTGRLKLFLPGVYLTKTPSVGGLSVVLHEKEDDFGQPTGNSGGRIGCGVIQLKDHVEISNNIPEKPTTNLPAPPENPSGVTK